MSLMYFFVFLFGAIIGSFLNVVILRFRTGRGVMGRSGCFSCGKTLSPSELIPIVSFLWQKGRCLECRTRISLQYPIVEFLMGSIVVVLFHIHMVSFSSISLQVLLFFILDIIIWGLLLAVLVYDMKHMIIPDLWSVTFSVLACIRIALSYIYGNHSILSAIVGALVLSGFFFILWFISRGAWIGLGDSKLAFGMGLYLGFPVGLSAFAYAFWIGATVALLKMGYERVIMHTQSVTMKSEVPFAPFLIIGTFFAFLFQSDVFHIQFFFS